MPTEGEEIIEPNTERTFTEEEVKAMVAAEIQKVVSNPTFLASIPPQNPNNAVKWSNIYKMMQKSKLTSFSAFGKDNIRDFLEKFYDDLAASARNLCEWDLDTSPLSDAQYSELLQIKLEYTVKKDVVLKFNSYNPKLTWKTVTRAKLNAILLELYSNKEPQISSVLKAFSANRFKKAPEMSVETFNCKWQEQMPLCFFPETETEKDNFVDLIHRTIYFHALDDKGLQKELSNVAESEQSLAKFHAEAIKAESRRIHYNDTAEKTGSLDASSDISVNRSEYVPNRYVNNRARGRGNRGNWRGSARGRGRGGMTPAQASGGGATVTPMSQTQVPQGAARGRGASKQKRYMPRCYNCHVVGHTVDKCPERYYDAPGNSKMSVEEYYEEEEDSEEDNLEAAGVNKISCTNNNEFTAFKFDVVADDI